MEHQLLFALFLAVFAFLVIHFDKKSGLLRDTSTAEKKPFSFSRVQMAWWSIIILSAFASVICLTFKIPSLDNSTLILLGIGIATTGIGRTVDVSDMTLQRERGQDLESEGFWLDLLSDKDGASISRFQAIAFNIVFGIWFITLVSHGLGQVPIIVEKVIPSLEPNHLILLGLGSGGYLAVKTTENKP